MGTLKSRLEVIESRIPTANKTLIFAQYDRDDEVISFAKFGGIQVAYRLPGECLQSLVDRAVIESHGESILMAIYADTSGFESITSLENGNSQKVK
jgi:hypothetical protein